MKCPDLKLDELEKFAMVVYYKNGYARLYPKNDKDIYCYDLKDHKTAFKIFHKDIKEK